MMSYQDARRFKREFREVTRPAIKDDLAGFTKKAGLNAAIKECECPIVKKELKLVKKFNKSVVKTMSHVYNKSVEEANKNYDETRRLGRQIIKDLIAQHKKEGLEGTVDISIVTGSFKSLADLFEILEVVAMADEVFKAHKERKHKKLAPEAKKGGKKGKKGRG